MEKLPWIDSNDTSPMWVGDTLYFLSDRGGTTNLFSYDARTKQVVARIPTSEKLIEVQFRDGKPVKAGHR